MLNFASYKLENVVGFYVLLIHKEQEQLGFPVSGLEVKIWAPFLLLNQAAVLDRRCDLPGYGGEGHVHLRVSEYQPGRTDNPGSLFSILFWIAQILFYTRIMFST
jgi:hypothetical protein